MRIDDIVYVKDRIDGGYWKGRVTKIHNIREITIRDGELHGIVLDIDDLLFKDGEYWEK